MEKDFAAGWRAAVQRIGDLMITVENDTHRAVINSLYRRMVAEGVPAEARPVEPKAINS